MPEPKLRWLVGLSLFLLEAGLEVVTQRVRMNEVWGAHPSRV